MQCEEGEELEGSLVEQEGEDGVVLVVSELEGVEEEEGGEAGGEDEVSDGVEGLEEVV
jgi:hypothetical protein